MATPPDSPNFEEAALLELEEQLDNSSAFQHARPVALEDLCRQTKFTRQEIRIMYRGFKQKCPEGVVHEDLFKDIYSKFFPHGNSNLYAQFVFKAFDVKCNGAISFKVDTMDMLTVGYYNAYRLKLPAHETDMLMTLSILLRGSIYEKLRWTFKLYDLNGDGCITRSELGQIVLAIHELMGKRPQGRNNSKTKDQTDIVFQKLDINQDGVITFEEFIESCLKDEAITNSLQVFDSRSL